MKKLIQGDCLEIMKDIDSESVDFILTDPPYGTTACKWDAIIPLEPMWEQLKRVIKPNGAIVMTAAQPFTSKLIMSNVKMFRYCWVWDKVISSNHMNAKKMPMKGFEDVCVFYKKLPTYNPQMETGTPFKDSRNNTNGERFPDEVHGSKPYPVEQVNKGTRYPRGFIKESARNNKPIHPTQKPVALMEYLIKTYTNENETVLDFTMGSGTTGVACAKTRRNFIGIELDETYFNIAKERLENKVT